MIAICLSINIWSSIFASCFGFKPNFETNSMLWNYILYMIIWFLIWGHLVFGNFSLSPPIKAFSTYWPEIGWSQTFKMGKIFNMGKMFKKFKPLDLSQSPNRWPHFFPSPRSRIECEGWITLQENQTNKILSILPFFLSEKRHWLFLRTFWPTLEQNQTPPVSMKFKRLKRSSTPESVVSYEYVA